MKVLMIAFGHPDNVFSLCNNIAGKIDISLVLVVSGNRFKQGILNIDISKLKFGLNTVDESFNVLPEELKKFLSAKLEFRIIRTHDKKVLRDKYFRNFRNIIKSSLKLKKENHEIIHFNGVSGFLLLMIPIFKKIKKIWTLHDFKPHYGEENKKAFYFQKLLTKFDLHILQHYKYLRSEIINEYKLFSKKVHQVYSGKFNVFNSFSPKKPSEFNTCQYILFFGRISKYKNIENLINVFQSIDNNSINLVIAGSGKLWFDLKGNGDNIIILNRYIETSELVYLIKNAKFIVVPYTDATHSATVMTAYAFNKPVVITNVGGISEVVQHKETGILVDPNDKEELKRSIEGLMNSEEMLSKMSEKINDFCINGHISWDSISEQMYELYSGILN